MEGEIYNLCQMMRSREKNYLGIMEYCMKNIHRRDMLQLLDKLLQAFNHHIAIDKAEGYIYIISLLCYTNNKVHVEQQGELNKIIHNYLSATGEDNIMRSIAQKYLDEGKAEGIQITGLTIKEIELIKG